jgi:hypothetical protein
MTSDDLALQISNALTHLRERATRGKHPDPQWEGSHLRALRGQIRQFRLYLADIRTESADMRGVTEIP